MESNLLKLEYNKILEKISNYCKTYIGKQYISRLRPSCNKEEVQEMLNETSEGVVLIQRNSTPPLDEIADINIYVKTLESYGSLSIKALLELQKILEMSARLKNYFKKDFLESSDFESLSSYFNDLYVNPSIVATFSKSINFTV